MPKSIETLSVAIDEVMTTMSQIALIDGATRAVREREPKDVDEVLEASYESTTELFSQLHTADISPDFLTQMVDAIAKDTLDVSAEKLARDVVLGLARERRQQIVDRQAEYAKRLRGKKLAVTLLADNIVSRCSVWDDEKFLDKHGLKPMKRDETFDLAVYGRLESSTPVDTFRYRRSQPFKNYIGYSLSGRYAGPDKKANGIHHGVSLVNDAGEPLVAITPK